MLRIEPCLANQARWCTGRICLAAQRLSVCLRAGAVQLRTAQASDLSAVLLQSKLTREQTRHATPHQHHCTDDGRAHSFTAGRAYLHQTKTRHSLSTGQHKVQPWLYQCLRLSVRPQHCTLGWSAQQRLPYLACCMIAGGGAGWPERGEGWRVKPAHAPSRFQPSSTGRLLQQRLLQGSCAGGGHSALSGPGWCPQTLLDTTTMHLLYVSRRHCTQWRHSIHTSCDRRHLSVRSRVSAAPCPCWCGGGGRQGGTGHGPDNTGHWQEWQQAPATHCTGTAMGVGLHALAMHRRNHWQPTSISDKTTPATHSHAYTTCGPSGPAKHNTRNPQSCQQHRHMQHTTPHAHHIQTWHIARHAI